MIADTLHHGQPATKITKERMTDRATRGRGGLAFEKKPLRAKVFLTSRRITEVMRALVDDQPTARVAGEHLAEGQARGGIPVDYAIDTWTNIPMTWSIVDQTFLYLKSLRERHQLG